MAEVVTLPCRLASGAGSRLKRSGQFQAACNGAVITFVGGHRAMRKVRAAMAAVAVLTLAACNHARVQTEEAYMGPPKAPPDRILVAYFAVSPEQVRLDQGIGARIVRTTSDQPLTAAEMQAAQATQVALANRLVEDLTKFGLPAQLAVTAEAPGTSLLVVGQIVAIDQGNRTRRILIGLGAGKSNVRADVQLYYQAQGLPPRFMAAYQGQADSGHMPGAAETMGAGAVAGSLASSAAVSGAMHATSEGHRAADTREASRLADGLARQIGEFAVSMGWIPAAALQR
jgi:Domain of unknown function (DUF4410)